MLLRPGWARCSVYCQVMSSLAASVRWNNQPGGGNNRCSSKSSDSIALATGTSTGIEMVPVTVLTALLAVTTAV